MRPEGLGKLIKVIHLIGSRTRDVPVCNIAPQPLRYRVLHILVILLVNLNNVNRILYEYKAHSIQTDRYRHWPVPDLV
jgi:hypothetical protein